MYRKLIGVMYVLNIVFQSFFTLVTPAAITFFISWLLVTYVGAPTWLYALMLIVGILSGLVSMVKFILTAMAGYERLENSRERLRGERDTTSDTHSSSHGNRQNDEP